MMTTVRVMGLAVLFCGLVNATPSLGQSTTEAPTASKSLKHKIAVGRFSNETRYGQSLLRDGDLDPLGKQASDILAAYLVQTGKFLVFERPDLAKIEREQNMSGEPAANTANSTIGVDALLVGSIVEFGRTEDGKRGLFNKERTQRAHAKVAVRLVDVRTGLAFHSVTGEGEATTDTRTILGMGSTSRFDGTLTDKALSVAVEAMLEEMVNSLSNRSWRTDILAVQTGQIFIAGGSRQGLRVGDTLKVMKPTMTVKSAQTGFEIPLPPTEVGKLQVVSFFGDSEVNEGSITSLTAGTLGDGDVRQLFVVAE